MLHGCQDHFAVALPDLIHPLQSKPRLFNRLQHARSAFHGWTSPPLFSNSVSLSLSDIDSLWPDLNQ
eukprot:2444703-Amphidinium_carterae.1